MKLPIKLIFLVAVFSFFNQAQANCVIVSEPDGESCTGTNPLGGACAWTPVNGGYICARNAASGSTAVPLHIPRDKVRRDDTASPTPAAIIRPPAIPEPQPGMADKLRQ